MLQKMGSAIAAFLIFFSNAYARNDGSFPVSQDPAVKKWFDTAGSDRVTLCCAEYDGVKEGTRREGTGHFTEWKIKGEERWVRLFPEGAKWTDDGPEGWYKVPKEAMVKKSADPAAKPPGFAIIWFSWQTNLDGSTLPSIKCFQEGPLM